MDRRGADALHARPSIKRARRAGNFELKRYGRLSPSLTRIERWRSTTCRASASYRAEWNTEQLMRAASRSVRRGTGQPRQV